MDYKIEAAEYLRNYNNLDVARQNLKDEIRELEADLKCIKPINYSGMPSGSGELPDDALINKMYRLGKAKEEYRQTLIAIKRMDKVLSKFAESNPEYHSILKMYYIDSLKEEEVLKHITYSERQFYRVKSKALKSFAIQIFGIKALGA